MRTTLFDPPEPRQADAERYEEEQDCRPASISGHLLQILSLHDAQATCSCGKWNYARTGPATLEEIEAEHAMHRPPAARGTDPGTSHQAAASVREVKSTQNVILGLLVLLGPMTDEKIAYHFRKDFHNPPSDSGLRTRRKELVTAGLVCDSGERGSTASGRKTIVWKAVKR